MCWRADWPRADTGYRDAAPLSCGSAAARLGAVGSPRHARPSAGPPPCPPGHPPPPGLCVKQWARPSAGHEEEHRRHLKRRLQKLKRLQRAVARKVKGSQNRKKAARRLGTQYRHVANQRANTVHQFTSRLAKTKSVVVIEDLNVAGMLKNHRLAQAIGDVGWGVFRRQLTYKAAWYGCRAAVARRWEPSSKTCSGCGWGDDQLTLADRVFH